MEVETEEELLYRAAQRELEQEQMAQKVLFSEKAFIKVTFNENHFSFFFSPERW